MGALVSLTISLTIRAFFLLVQITIYLFFFLITGTLKLINLLVQGVVLAYVGVMRLSRYIRDRAIAA